MKVKDDGFRRNEICITDLVSENFSRRFSVTVGPNPSVLQWVHAEIPHSSSPNFCTNEIAGFSGEIW